MLIWEASEPVQLSVRLRDGQPVADLLVDPKSTIHQVKIQLAGLEGTAVGNQTLLLGGRAPDDSATLASLGLFHDATLVLVRCEPLLLGRLTELDLQRLVNSSEALNEAIDAFKEDPSYNAAEVGEIISTGAASLLPWDPCLASEILDALPLDLLIDGESLPPVVDRAAGMEVGNDADNATSTEPVSQTDVFDIGHEDSELELRGRERRERFVDCVCAGLEMLLHALRQHNTGRLKSNALESA